MNLEGVALKLLLEESDKEKALQIYSELRPNYFSNSFATILNHIRTYYDHYGSIPSLQDLKIYRNRDLKVQAALNTIELLDEENIDINLAVEELANQHAQNATLLLFDKVLDDIPIKDRYEILESISSLPMKLEELIDKSNLVYTLSDTNIFESVEDTKSSQIIAGISDTWDYQMGGYYKQDLVLLGGKRGSGKSVVCANLVANQHRQGKPSLYFTIEMTYKETLQRIICILAKVEFGALKKNQLTLEQKKSIARTMASFYIGGEEVFDKHFSVADPDVFGFQAEVQKLEEKPEGRIIIIDDRDLNVATVDTKVGSYKSRYGDDLGLIIIDYLNQLVLDGTADMYDWKDQIVVSKTLKNLARKHDVCIVSPYQMDDEGKARFSKGILDSCDVAQLILVEDKEKGILSFKTDKMRSGTDQGNHTVSIDWKTLSIDPREVVIEDVVEEPVKKKKKKSSDEPMEDLGLNL